MKQLKNHSVLLLSTTSVLILLLLGYLFDSYLNNLANETLQNWLRSEDAAIAEGNLLTSVSKNQKAIESSEYLKGVALLNFDKPRQLEEIEFGEKIDSNEVKLDGDSTIQIKRVGPFKRYAIAKLSNQKNMYIVFSIWSTGLRNIAAFSVAMFGFLFLVYAYLLNSIKRSEYALRTEQTRSYAEKAVRVAHDIRTPLMSLNATIDTIEGNPTAVAKLLMVAKNLKEITSDLTESRISVVKEVAEASAPITETEDTIENQLSQIIEARKDFLESKTIDFKFSYSGISSAPLNLERPIFRRIINNILENAIDAISHDGSVGITSRETDWNLIVEISDNGKGIPKSVLPMIGKKGFSHGKKNGTGIGLHSAIDALEKAGGSLAVESEEGTGTKISLTIPKRKNCVLSNRHVRIGLGNTLAILDDDDLVLKTWDMQLKNLGIKDKINISTFTSPNQVLDANLDLSRTLLISDFDLKSDLDGIDVVNRLGATNISLLVTGSSDDPFVIGKAASEGKIPILSKNQIADLKFEVVS